MATFTKLSGNLNFRLLQKSFQVNNYIRYKNVLTKVYQSAHNVQPCLLPRQLHTSVILCEDSFSNSKVDFIDITHAEGITTNIDEEDDLAFSERSQRSNRQDRQSYGRFDSPPPSSKVMVRNIPYGVTADVLKDLFPHAVNVRIPLDQNTQKSRGFAFVQFPSVEDAQAAILQHNATEFMTRRIYLAFAVDKFSQPTTPHDNRFNQQHQQYQGYQQQPQEPEIQYEQQSDDSLEQLLMAHRKDIGKQHRNEKGMSFSDFSLTDRLQAALGRLGYEKPFEIQTQTLNHTLNGRDVIAKSVTGSGKTLAFSIPIVHKLQNGERQLSQSPSAIVISPTRELCLQIHRSIQELDRGILCVALYGGASIRQQQNQLRRGVDVICATPGRLADMFRNRCFFLDKLSFLCLDEADELLTPNFKDQIQEILDQSPQEKQTFLFSATMPSDVNQLIKRHMNDPVTVDITDSQKYKAPECVTHLAMQATRSNKFSLIKDLLVEKDPQRSIVFCDTKAQTTSLARFLRLNHKIPAEAINSDLSQNRREVIMNAFRAGKIKILIATDVAARGIDVPEIDLIIQSPPKNGTEYYIHRSGRTGRAGRDGTSIMLYDVNDLTELKTMAQVADLVDFDFITGGLDDFQRYHQRYNPNQRYTRGYSRGSQQRGQFNNRGHQPNRRRDWWE